MPSILFISAVLAGVAKAYTQVNAASAFMFKNIDPIKKPSLYNSHLHSFFGSDAVTANTTTSAELQKGCTNTENPNDLSVYWIPTPLYTTDGGKTYKPLPLARFSAYYNLGETQAEVAIPQNLHMVAGISNATSEAEMDPKAMSSWACEGENVGVDANGFPRSTCSTHIQQLIYFPQCVNTATLETSYKDKPQGVCPAGMKSMPQLRFSVRWNARTVLPDGWNGTAPIKLSSGPAWSSHGDFINGWTTEAATNMVATTKEKQKFFPVNGALGAYNSGPTCTAKDVDPTRGTSDYVQSIAEMGKRDTGSWGWSSKSRFVRS